MTGIAFTPLKFATLATFAAIIALGATATPSTSTARPQAENLDLSGFLRGADAIAYDNGALTENLYLAASYTPITPSRGPERHGLSSAPQAPQPVVRHNYPPLAR